MSWVVTIHSEDGSMGEAADSIFTVVAPDKGTAEDMAAMLNRVISSLGHHHLWAVINPIDAVTGHDSDLTIKEQLRLRLIDRFGD